MPPGGVSAHRFHLTPLWPACRYVLVVLSARNMSDMSQVLIKMSCWLLIAAKAIDKPQSELHKQVCLPPVRRNVTNVDPANYNEQTMLGKVPL